MAITNRLQIAYVVLSLFAISRPILTLSFFAEQTVLNLTYLEIYGLGSSYILVFLMLLHLKTLHFDRSIIVLFIFFCYLAMSVVWGSQFRDTIRIMAPFLLLIAVRSILIHHNQAIFLIKMLLFGYCLPVLGTGWLIFHGKSLAFTVFWTGIDRYKGLYSDIHTMSHAMFILIATACICLSIHATYRTFNFIFLLLLYIMLIIAFFNVFKSYTRTVYIGTTIFITFFCIGNRYYKTLIILILLAVYVSVYSIVVHDIFFDVVDPLRGEGDISGMGSGRIGGWTLFYSDFSHLPLYNQLLGFGIGTEGEGSRTFFGALHSDIISILYSLGYIGLAIYIFIQYTFIKDMLMSKLFRNVKVVYIGLVVSVFVMNMVSNSYLTRFSLSQVYHVLIGIFYVLESKIEEDGAN